MGLLDYIKESEFVKGGAPVRKAISGLLDGDVSGISNAYGQVKQLFNPEYMRQVKPMSNEQAISMAMDINPILHTAYHGSPHLFDKFDMSKIGTGIRYLDAGSRGQGAGSMNTVLFDDSLVKILERNGQPTGLLK